MNSICGRRSLRGYSSSRWLSSFSAPASAARCAPSPTITRRPCRSGSRCATSGSSSGRLRGSSLGVQFSIALVALKALPVLMLGGLTSVPGAIVGGLVVGAGEKLSEVFLGPYFGGGIENWFAYVLALLVLLVRPQGLFGERIIERV